MGRDRGRPVRVVVDSSNALACLVASDLNCIDSMSNSEGPGLNNETFDVEWAEFLDG